MSLAADFRAAFPDLFVTRVAVAYWLEEQAKAGGTLAAAREQIRARAENGIDCPTCGQLCKRYHNKFTANTARWLVALCALSRRGEFVHVRDIFARAHAEKRGSHADNYHLLHRWGLIEPAISDADQDRAAGRKPGRAGLWRPTRKGLSFVNGRATVPLYCVTFCGEVEGLEGEEVAIRRVLGERFDFEELMRGDRAYEEVEA